MVGKKNLHIYYEGSSEAVAPEVVHRGGRTGAGGRGGGGGPRGAGRAGRSLGAAGGGSRGVWRGGLGCGSRGRPGLDPPPPRSMLYCSNSTSCVRPPPRLPTIAWAKSS